MSNEPDKYPRRIKDLQDSVKKIKNGDSETTPTAAQARKLTLQVADIIPDLWDSIASTKQQTKRVDEMYPFFKAGKWAIALVVGANILFLINNILGHVFTQP